MPTGRAHASALLSKVNSQLRGERVPLKTKEEDELAVSSFILMEGKFH